MTFYESTEANNASLAINYIIARHGNNTKLAKEIMAKLKKSLKDKSYSFLKKFGDPDAHGKYNEVIKKWNDYTKELTKKEESRNTMQRYKSKFKEGAEISELQSLFDKNSKGQITLDYNDTLSMVTYSRVLPDRDKIIFMSNYSSIMSIYFKEIDLISIKTDQCKVFCKNNLTYTINF